MSCDLTRSLLRGVDGERESFGVRKLLASSKGLGWPDAKGRPRLSEEREVRGAKRKGKLK